MVYSDMRMSEHKNLILFGPPGVGKGTQAAKLVKEYSLPHIDTGALIRKAIENGTDLGVKAKSFVESGKLVPDDLIIELIKEKLIFLNLQQISGFILDGYPRTIPQAEALERVLTEIGISISKVLSLKAPKDVVVSRLSARRLCTKKTCHNIYNLVTKPPQVEGKCDVCHSDLYQRKDDSQEACEARFVEYDAKTAPLETYYKSRLLFSEIDATKSENEVFNDIVRAL